MQATIVTIGDEILIGQIVDSNSSYIAKSLDKIGIATHEMLSISDDREHILSTFKKLQNNTNVVIITGGLGPTKDDITKKTFCDYFDDELIEDKKVLAHVTALIEGFYKRPITQLNKDQALVPSKAKILFNEMGTAPGMWMEHENTIFISLPGVPYEMKHLMEKEVIPNLMQKFERPFIIHQTIMTYGRGESLVAEQIEEWENNLPSFIKLAYLPSPGRVRLRLSARGTSEVLLREALKTQIETLTPLLEDIIVGFEEEETLEVVVAKKLTEKGQTIATAESCTGGKIGQMLAAISGASAYFKGSLTTYATQSKIDVLGVLQKTIEENSVVSAEVAIEMAQNVKQILQSDYAIATTGNAGPTKGDSDAELGIVFIALATPNSVLVERFEFGQPREKVIDRATNKALELVYKEILKK